MCILHRATQYKPNPAVLPASFVSTDECDAHINFKQAYLNAKAEDITIIESPWYEDSIGEY